MRTSRLSPMQAAWRLALTLAAITLPLYAVKVALKGDYTDFSVYYRAAARAQAGAWSEIYTLSDGASPFRYAPITLIFFRPFAALSREGASVAWYLLQYAWFALGFFWIYRALARASGGPNGLEVEREAGRARALFATSLSFLFVLRFCLDCFTIGQVSSLLFAGFAWAFYAYTRKEPGSAALGLFVPTVFKIGPGFEYFLLLSESLRGAIRSVLAALLGLLVLCAVTLVWLGSWQIFSDLIRDWVLIVSKDSEYYDASHYGSQSLKSFLLRLSHGGALDAGGAAHLYMLLAVLGCVGVIAFWFLRSPRTPAARPLFFSLGVFPYLWFMPETFKYTLTVLALPAASLLRLEHPRRLTRVAIVAGFVLMSCAGKDIVGDTIFFALQNHSVPFFCTLLLAAAVLREALRGSEARSLARGRP